MRRLLLGIFILVVIAAGAFIFYREGSLPLNKDSTEIKHFVINPGEGLNSITKRLATESLIRSRVVFYLMVKKQGIEKKIQAGNFKLQQSMSAQEVAVALTHGTDDVRLQIIEGLRKEEVAEIVAKQFPTITESEFTSMANEGYLFPETYYIPKTATTKDIIDVLSKTFNEKFTADLRNNIKKRNLTNEQAVILASIVEREARSKQAKNQVASILLKRIQQDMPLQVDASVQYLLGYQPQEKTWWKRYLSSDDLKIKSIYNTYTNSGLPPHALCSPGTDALEAVANADASTPYLFYITGDDNQMHYAKTADEHQVNVDNFLK